jgi:hypothetical protein
MKALAKLETLTLQLPATAVEVQKLEAAAADLTSILPEVVVTDDATYGVADELLTQAVQLIDAAKICRSSVTAPVYKKIKEVEARFRPALQELEAFQKGVKAALGDYRIELAQAEAHARALAQEAAVTGDADALVESLNDADALAQKPADTGARVAVRWRVKRINPDLLPHEWWCPDEARIQEVALDHRGGVDDPPVIPGVVFEPVAEVKAKH